MKKKEQKKNPHSKNQLEETDIAMHVELLIKR